MKKLYFSISILFISLFTLSSCNSTDENYSRLTYKPGPPVQLKEKQPPPLLYIEKVIDKRRKSEDPVSYSINADPYILIPLWLWSHSDIDPVLRFSFFQEPLPLIIQGLVFTDLKVSGLFQEVTMSNKYYNLYKDKAYKLRVTLLNANWSRTLTSYGLSYPGTILWAFGLPVSYGDVAFKIKAELYLPGNSQSPVASTTISKNVDCTEWIYDQVNYSPPISEFKLAEIFPEAIKELRTFLYKKLYENSLKN